MGIEIIFPLVPLAFLCELVDSSLGMGYGTTLTPLLLLLGYEPLEIVPAVLLSEFLTGLLAGLFHHEFGNANLRPGSLESKVAAVLTAFSILGVVAAVMVTVSIPPWAVEVYIGLVVLGVGLLILTNRHRQTAFSWRRIGGLGLLAAFNKGISGGGYGPLVTGGQMLSGMEGRCAVAVASLAEGITSAVGVGIYMLHGVSVDLQLAPSLVLGAVLSVPFAAFIVSRIPSKRLTLTIGGLTTVLGSYTLLRVFL